MQKKPNHFVGKYGNQKYIKSLKQKYTSIY